MHHRGRDECQSWPALESLHNFGRASARSAVGRRVETRPAPSGGCFTHGSVEGWAFLDGGPHALVQPVEEDLHHPRDIVQLAVVVGAVPIQREDVEALVRRRDALVELPRLPQHDLALSLADQGQDRTGYAL